MKLELTADEAQRLFSYLRMLSGRLASQHSGAFTAEEKEMLIKEIRPIDSLAVEVREQANAQGVEI